jgi:hypothetical protein
MLNLEQNFTKIFGTAALPALNALFFDEYEQSEDPRSMLFNMETTDRELVQKLEVSSLGLMGVTAEGEQAPKDAFNQSFSKNYSIIKYAKAIGISDEMISDDQWSMISDMVKSGARSAKETELVTAFNIFNNAFTTETASDGVAIISASHPSQIGNQSNTLSAAADLSYSSLAEAEQVFRQFRDDRGKHLLIKPRILLVSESDRQNALEIVQSPYKANTANNNINALGADGGLTVISSPYLTDSDAWFLLSEPSLAGHGLRIIDREKLMTKTHEDVLAGVLYYKFQYRQAVGCDKWRGIVGTAGA